MAAAKIVEMLTRAVGDVGLAEDLAADEFDRAATLVDTRANERCCAATLLGHAVRVGAMTEIDAVLFDYSGTLFRLEEDETWFDGIRVDDRQVDGHVQAELMRRLTARPATTST